MGDRAAVSRMEETGFGLVTRFEDISRALADPATFSSSRGNSTVDTPVRVGKTLGTIDPPRHDELRRIVLRGFTPARIEAVQPGVREHTRRQVAEFVRRGGGDLFAGLGAPRADRALWRVLRLHDEAGPP